MRARVKVVVRVANSAAVSNASLAKHVTRRALTQPGVHGVPEIVLLSEVSSVDVSLFWHDTHDVLQYGKPGSPQAGVAIAVRRDTGRRLHRGSYTRGSARTSEGGGIRERPIISDLATVNGSVTMPYSAGHPPPPRSPRARAVNVTNMRRLRGVLGADFNTTIPVLRRSLTRKVRGVGVLALVIPRWVRCSPAYGVEIGSDHLAVDVALYLPARRTKETP